jgi:hypothetical protein
MDIPSDHSVANYEGHRLEMLQWETAAHKKPIVIITVYPDAINIVSSKHSSDPTKSISPVNRRDPQRRHQDDLQACPAYFFQAKRRKSYRRRGSRPCDIGQRKRDEQSGAMKALSVCHSERSAAESRVPNCKHVAKASV